METFGEYIELGQAPRKKVVEEFLNDNKENTEFNGKRWTDVKNIVWNKGRRNKKPTTDINRQILAHFSREVKAGRKPTQKECKNFLLSLKTTTTPTWQRVQRVVGGAIKKGKK